MFGAFTANYVLKNIERRHVPITMMAFFQLRGGDEIEVFFLIEGILKSLPSDSAFSCGTSSLGYTRKANRLII